MNIGQVSAVNQSILNISESSNKEDISSSFSDILKSFTTETESLRQTDIQNNTLMAIGELNSLHQPMIDMQKANLALQFTIQVRNKILDAYQEIMAMQI